jgi:hypothetical protein
MSEGRSSYWNAIKQVYEASDIYSGEQAFFASTSPFSRPLVLLYAAHFCQSEVHNGGFLQFFWNPTGVLAPEAIEGFKLIGMPNLASTLELAAAPLGSPYPRDRDTRWDALLDASGLEDGELEDIFKDSPNLYLAYLKATEALGWDALNKEAWELAKTENGGFQEAADRYASHLKPSGSN